MRWLETVALGVYVYDLTLDPFLVGFVGFLRMAPMLFLGAFIGAFSDRANRRVILATTNLILAATYLTLGFLILTDRIELWHISLGAIISGVVWATDFPVRRAMIADAVPADRVSSAFGVDMASSNFSRVIGPVVGGVFLQEIGMQAVYFLGTGLFVFASSLAFSMLIVRKPPTSATRTPATSSNFDLRTGVKHVMGDAVLLVTIIITIIMNFFAFPYQQMIPVLGAEKLMVDPIFVGLLISVEGLGATLGSLTIAAAAQPRHFTRIYTYASLSFFVVITAFALIPWYWVVIRPTLHRRLRHVRLRHHAIRHRRIIHQARNARPRPRRIGGGDRVGTHRSPPRRLASHPNRHRHSSPSHRHRRLRAHRRHHPSLPEVFAEYSAVSAIKQHLCNCRHSGESRRFSWTERPSRGKARENPLSLDGRGLA